jgi:IS30 family transposase
MAGVAATERPQLSVDSGNKPCDKRCLLAQNPRLQRVVARKLSQDWAPEQISGWLKTEYASDPTMRVSHETIYRSLFVQARGVLKKELMSHLRSKRTMRRCKKSSRGGHSHGQIVNAVSIRERPAEADDRAVVGHWEGDLVLGTATSQIATLVERHSRFVMLVKLRGRDTETVVKALSKQIKKLPTQLRRSLTWDRRHEMAAGAENAHPL